jgi:hypothetical protein
MYQLQSYHMLYPTSLYQKAFKKLTHEKDTSLELKLKSRSKKLEFLLKKTEMLRRSQVLEQELDWAMILSALEKFLVSLEYDTELLGFEKWNWTMEMNQSTLCQVRVSPFSLYHIFMFIACIYREYLNTEGHTPLCDYTVMRRRMSCSSSCQIKRILRADKKGMLQSLG